MSKLGNRGMTKMRRSSSIYSLRRSSGPINRPRGWFLGYPSPYAKSGSWVSLALGQEWPLRLAIGAYTCTICGVVPIGLPIGIGLSQPKVAQGLGPKLGLGLRPKFSWDWWLHGIVPTQTLGGLSSCKLQSGLYGYVPTRFGAP